MDNKAYLDEIAVKSKKKFSAGPILTPLMIKLIAAAAVAVIAMVVIGGILSAKNNEVAEIHQTVYARISSIVGDESPYEEYAERLKSSDLRTYVVQMTSSMDTTLSAIDSYYPDASKASSKVIEENSGTMTALMTTFEDAKLNGQLDKTLASETAYQLSMLISLEQQARAKSTNDDYAQALDNSIATLKHFKNYSKIIAIRIKTKISPAKGDIFYVDFYSSGFDSSYP